MANLSLLSNIATGVQAAAPGITSAIGQRREDLARDGGPGTPGDPGQPPGAAGQESTEAAKKLYFGVLQLDSVNNRLGALLEAGGQETDEQFVALTKTKGALEEGIENSRAQIRSLGEDPTDFSRFLNIQEIFRSGQATTRVSPVNVPGRTGQAPIPGQQQVRVPVRGGGLSVIQGGRQ